MLISEARPLSSELRDPGRFQLVEEIPHEAVFLFVRRNLYRITWITSTYWLLNAAAVAVIAGRWRAAHLPIFDSFSTVCLGMLLAYLALVPVHENLHAAAYRMAGAKLTRVKYDLRRLTALCTAPDEVVSGKVFVSICLAPIMVLNPALLALALFVPHAKAALLMAGALLLHTGACSGDIAFVNFVTQYPLSELFTVDEQAANITRFYRCVTRPLCLGKDSGLPD